MNALTAGNTKFELGFQSMLYQPANTAISSQGGEGTEQGGEGGKRKSEKGRESCPPQALSTQCNLPPLSLRPSPSPLSFFTPGTQIISSLSSTQVLAKHVT